MHSHPRSTGATGLRSPGVDRVRSGTALVGLLAAAAAGLAFFWNLGAVRPQTPSSESVLLETLRLAGVGVTGWLLVSALLALVATTIDRAGGAAGACGVSDTLRRCASPLVRRLVERAVAATMLTSVVTSGIASGPVNALGASEFGTAPRAEIGEPPREPEEEPVVRMPQPVVPRAPVSSPASPVVPPPSDPAVHVPAIHVPAIYVIVAGDNLWSVAADHLAASASGTRPGDAEIGAYWARLIEANRSTLRSGDPDLVFPGERIALPPTRR